MKLPEKIKVGPRTYQVICNMASWAKVVDSQNDASMWGCTKHEELNIYLYPMMSDNLKVETLVHEVSHCVNNVCGLDNELDDDKTKITEEQVVVRTAPIWLQIFRDNPKFMKYVMKDHSLAA